MDVQQRLDEIVATVDGARSMPMSASCVVNRAELLTMLEEVREALPGSLAQAQELLGGREQMVAQAQEEAQRIIETAQAERGSLVSGTEVARYSQDEADRIVAEARREAAEIRAEADDYVDSKLANFEVVLSKTMGSVERGREKLLGSGPGADQYGQQYAEDAPERTADPAELRQRADAYVDARLGSVSAVLGKTLEAVGRGRQKLLGHSPNDDLGAHMAAQDGAGIGQLPHTSDADYLAGLAEIPGPRAEMPQPEVARQEIPPQAPSHGMPPQPPAAPQIPPQPTADPYYAQQAQEQAQMQQMQAQQMQAQQGGYYDQQNAYYDQQQAAGYYGQQPAHGYTDPSQQGYDPQYDPQYYPQPQEPQHQQSYQQQAAALDETSLFDTSMIDLNQVRQYEERYDQGR
ncbi:cell division initiation protein [Streptomyces sp. N2-109]|uniref:Cell division initiation protein n=1 Tax=Streptomyces gossypii TaxID=2883101 RepID=A0ABT2K2A1_9ACTN|nr:cell division initiation protein [Streptomyces gossypii]MCT2594297.1 cell division initiation protein [Streptomyces gossypii]